jgi:hypothetical protein
MLFNIISRNNRFRYQAASYININKNSKKFNLMKNVPEWEVERADGRSYCQEVRYGSHFTQGTLIEISIEN